MSYSRLNTLASTPSTSSSSKWNPYVLGAIGLAGVVGIAALIYLSSGDDNSTSEDQKGSSSKKAEDNSFLRSLERKNPKKSAQTEDDDDGDGEGEGLDKEDFQRQRLSIQTLCQQKNYSEAEIQLRALMTQLSKANSTALLAEVQRYTLAQILFQLAKYEDALQEAVTYLAICEAVPQLGANYIPAFTLFVGCLIRVDKVDEAEQMLLGLLKMVMSTEQKAARLDPYDYMLMQERIAEIVEAKKKEGKSSVFDDLALQQGDSTDLNTQNTEKSEEQREKKSEGKTAGRPAENQRRPSPDPPTPDLPSSSPPHLHSDLAGDLEEIMTKWLEEQGVDVGKQPQQQDEEGEAIEKERSRSPKIQVIA